jgi:hypothetical protein
MSDIQLSIETKDSTGSIILSKNNILANNINYHNVLRDILSHIDCPKRTIKLKLLEYI